MSSQRAAADRLCGCLLSAASSWICVGGYTFLMSHTLYDTPGFYVPSRYQIQSVLGSGSYGTVCCALDTPSNHPVAIKKLSNIFHKPVLLTRAVRELKLLHHFRGHPNVVSLLDADLVYLKPYDGLYCVQEIVDYDLARVIHSGVQFSELHIRLFTYQLLAGLHYIHSADVIHRDLKPGNLLCSTTGVLKICDFGLARGYSTRPPATRPITHYVATRWYRAPELILSPGTYTKAIDLWAVGCVVAELYGRKPPFVGSDQIQQISEITKSLGSPPGAVTQRMPAKARAYFAPPKPQYHPVPWAQVYPYASTEAVDLMGRLLTWDPALRLSVGECLNHEFVKDVRDTLSEVVARRFDCGFEGVGTSQMKVVLQEEVEKVRAGRRAPRA